MGVGGWVEAMIKIILFIGRTFRLFLPLIRVIV